ncbi:hypothetical protein DM860_017892 [Cuscuta australis]|uniref:Pectinesterase inhibitor domain-containing protein n=1 Tax=Cuscuta australis TaxID=267555 RepID=A0A328DVC7_9ASTE|nr:hypothetical protein DM860_017892 [Cuscuta australis]
MRPSPLFSFISPLTIFTLLLLHAPPPSTAALANPTTASAPYTDFILKSCQNTLYPDTCYASLSGYASAVRGNVARLARVAISVSLNHAKSMTTYVGNDNLSPLAEGGGEHRAVAAICDCSSTLSDSVDQIQDSLQQMKQLGGSAEDLAFQLSNVLTWMSAAETNEDTCVDGFDNVADGSLRSDVYDGVVKVKQLTSNALALVNAFANKVAKP